MRLHLNRSLVPALGLALLIVLLFAMTACSKTKQDNAATPIPLDFSQAEQVHQDITARPLDDTQNSFMEGADSEGNQRCRQLCKKTCVRGRQCNVPNFANIRRCAKSCLQACNNNLLPESFDDCIKPDSKCAEVVDCLKKLRDVIKEKQAAKKQQAPEGQEDIPDIQ